jgi:succinate dehydrogenase / fumarate reductase flavoprotein subunit
MSESLRNDGRVWLPVRPGDERSPQSIPEDERDYFLERQYPRYGNMVPRDVASRRVRERCLAGQGVGPHGRPGGMGVYLDLRDAIAREGRATIEARYGNLLEMYGRITGEDPIRTPMRIYPAPHYTMGGLWVDYQLMSTIPGLFVLGEANFSEHGANRLGASALMQGLADGTFIAPATVTAWLASRPQPEVNEDHPACREALADTRRRLDALSARGRTGRPAATAAEPGRTVDQLHRELGLLMIDACGISRSGPRLEQAIGEVRRLRQRFAADLRLPDPGGTIDPELEKAWRLEDFLDLADLMLRDALTREESCGAHFREEHQSPEGEALRDDEHFAHIAAWEFRGEREPRRHAEPLRFTTLRPGRRDYR